MTFNKKYLAAAIAGALAVPGVVNASSAVANPTMVYTNTTTLTAKAISDITVQEVGVTGMGSGYVTFRIPATVALAETDGTAIARTTTALGSSSSPMGLFVTLAGGDAARKVVIGSGSAVDILDVYEDDTNSATHWGADNTAMEMGDFASATTITGAAEYQVGEIYLDSSTGEIVMTLTVVADDTAAEAMVLSGMNLKAVTESSTGEVAISLANGDASGNNGAGATADSSIPVLTLTDQPARVTGTAAGTDVPTIAAGAANQAMGVLTVSLVGAAAGDDNLITIALNNGAVFRSDAWNVLGGAGNAITVGTTAALQTALRAEADGVDATDDGGTGASITVDSNGRLVLDLGSTDLPDGESISIPVDTALIDASSVSAGSTITATVTGSGTDLAGLSATADVATAAALGVSFTVVDNTTNAFSATPTAATTVPSTPAGRSNVELASFQIDEDLADSLQADDELVITLPTGVTFANQPAIELSDAAHLTAAVAANPTGFSQMTINVTNAGNTVVGGILVGDASGNVITVNVGSSVAAGDIVATISGTVAGEAMTAVDVVLGTVVDSAVTVAANSTVPVRGIGTSGQAIGAFTITEAVANSLLANNSTITVTLPSGVTWNSEPTSSVSDGDLTLSSTATLSSSDSVATFNVTAASGTASTIEISGDIDIASSVAAGDIEVTIGGTAGATGTAAVATAAVGTSTTVGAIPTLTVGTPTQSVSTITITEAFAGALAADGIFRVVLPSGLTWAATSPTITTSAVSGTKLVTTVDTVNSWADGTFSSATSWEFERGTTFASNDTLLIQVPDTASTGATTVNIAGLKANVAAGASTGNITASLVDGDLNAASGAGVIASSQIIGYVGTPDTLAADSTSVSVIGTNSGTVNLTGGLGTLSITTAPDSAVATASLSNGVLTVTGVAAGTTTIVVSDSSATAQTVTIGVTVADAGVVPPLTTNTGTVGATADATGVSFAGGVSADGGATYSDTLTAGSSVDLAMSVTPNTAHTSGSVYLVLSASGTASLDGVYVVSSTGLSAWAGVADMLTRPYATADGTTSTLQDVASISIPGVPFPAGTYMAIIAYTDADGNLYYNETPVSWTVQ